MSFSSFVLAVLLAFFAWWTRKQIRQLTARADKAESRLADLVSMLERGAVRAGAAETDENQATEPVTGLQAATEEGIAEPAIRASADAAAASVAGDAIRQDEESARPEPVVFEEGGPWSRRKQAKSAGPDKPARSLEETIGSRWSIWVGGLAFALGGLFLVRYSIEAGIFSPAVRMAIAAFAGLAALAGGEFIRRREIRFEAAGDRSAHVPAVLTAAGLAILFGVVFASHGIYAWISSAPAFALMGALSVIAIALAIPHGTALAGLGLVGSFVTPVLVASNAPNPMALFGFLSVILLAAAALARLKNAAWVLVLGLAGTAVWLVLDGLHSPAVSLTASLMALAAMVLAMAVFWLRGREGPQSLAVAIAGPSGWPVFTGVLLFLFATLTAFGGQGFDLPDPRHAAGAAALMLLLMALWRPNAVHGAPGASILLSAIYAGWIMASFHTVTFVLDYFLRPGASFIAEGSGPDEGAFLTFATATAIIPLAAGVLMAWRLAADRWTAMLWAFSAALPVLVACGLAVGAFANWGEDLAYGPGTLALAFVLSAAGYLLWRREATMVGDSAPARMMTASALLFLAASLPLGIAIHLLTVPAWTGIVLALLALALAYGASRGAPAIFAWIAVLGGIATMARFAIDPSVAGGDLLSTTPVLNWLTPGYFVPAAAFAASAFLMRGDARTTPRRLMEAMALTAGLAGIAVLIRHAMQGGVLSDDGPVTLAEQASYTLLALGASLALVRLDDRSPSPVFRFASMMLGVVGIITVVIQHFGLLNPYFTNRFVGNWPVVNLLGAAYLLPGLLAGIVAWQANGRRPRLYVQALAGLLLFAWLNLEVRRFWQGAYIGDWKETSAAETYTYSAVWLVAGVALLAAGLRFNRQVLRLASAALVVLTVLKVFLFDMAELEGVMRAASFMGLGLCLIGIGLFYQRILGKSVRIRPEPQPDV